jgi:hypothetical protein
MAKSLDDVCPKIGIFHGPRGRFGGEPFFLRMKKEARTVKLKIWGSMEIKPTIESCAIVLAINLVLYICERVEITCRIGIQG